MFDARDNKSFVNLRNTFRVWPSDRKKPYTQPYGWTRYGLHVLTGNSDEDAWLHPFGHDANWWRAFHGTTRSGRYMPSVDASVPQQMANAALNAIAQIYKGGFNQAHQTDYGPGVYCSPVPTFVENGYAATVPLYLEGNQVINFKVMLQVAVRPGSDTLNERSDNQVWAVRECNWICPFGILFQRA
ncbi:hypothetical protein ACA910_019568 [Epithemia clementina (nom. ined.)]